ncbi:MAG TPA: hypothetical protein ENJ65_03670 [Candidatus Tenderia electrophaga]|uniref:Uncharacterized protein n=1 Tax=Candidatus Tenderia electrophaga TaxID=1748243 RepID=A0A832J8Y7_9GAMM|nr:hypothetical protein [Candidatus Tenderia electrophaga]
MTVETRVIKRHDVDRNALDIHDTELLNKQAAFMLQFIERWGMVAATEHGEDSAGRSKLRLLTPAELVDRAAVTAELAFAEMRRRGLIVDLPCLDEIHNADIEE